MPIDPEIEKHLKDLGASLATLQGEIAELKKNPGANAAQIKLVQDEISALRGEIKKTGGPAPTKGFFESLMGEMYGE